MKVVLIGIKWASLKKAIYDYPNGIVPLLGSRQSDDKVHVDIFPCPLGHGKRGWSYSIRSCKEVKRWVITLA